MRDVLVALFAEGHVLIEDYPGVGKTALARALARSVDAEYARIQCTADLLPADVVGTNVYNQRENRFEFRPGPVFANVVLVDEVNRASPKTQSGPARVHAGAPRDRGQAHARAGAAVHRRRHPEPGRVRGHLPAARGAARPLHGARVARLSVAPSRRADMLARPRRARPRARPRARGRRGRRARRAGRPPARCTAARRCAATSSRSSTPPAPTRAWSSARARAPGLMLFRAAKAHGRARRARPRAARRRPGAAPAPCSPTACCSRPAPAPTSAPRSCATPWSGSRRSDAADAAARRRSRRCSVWRCAWPARPFDTPSLYVPGVALIVLLGGGAVAWVRAGRARGDGRAHARARPRSWRTSPTRCAWRCAQRRRCRRPAASCSSRCSAGPCRSAGRWSRRLRINVRFSRRGRRVLEPERLVIRDPLRLYAREVYGDRRGRGAGAAARRARDRARRRRRGQRAPTPGIGAAPSLSGRRLDASTRRARDRRPARRTARARPRRASTGRPWRARGEMLERRLVAELDSAPLIVLDPSAPAGEEALDMAVRAAASLCVHLARRKDGCAMLLPGERRPVEIGHDLGAWPARARAARAGRGGPRARRAACSARAAAR